MPQRIIVPEHHHGVLYRNGVYQCTLEPGRHRRWKGRFKVHKLDIRRQLSTVPAQELLTADGIGVKVTAVIEWQITNAALVVSSVSDVTQSLYVSTQLAMRDVLSSKNFDEVMAQRTTFGEPLLAAIEPGATGMGIQIHRVEIKDIMLPGDLKRVFAQVAEAKQQGLADLERARAQTATLRSLANVAKMLKDNPELVQARLLDAIEHSKGNTFVVGKDFPSTS